MESILKLDFFQIKQAFLALHSPKIHLLEP